MIYITGDTHSDFRRFSRRVFPEQADMTKEDYVIIAGDFGGIWYSLEDSIHQRMERYNLDELDDRSFTTLFIPGNHENYDRLMSDEFPVEEWNGGMVKKIRPSILMLMRGEMYNIDGAKIFAFGAQVPMMFRMESWILRIRTGGRRQKTWSAGESTFSG